jgi:phosphoribosylformylglycinamidine synthase
VLQVADGQLGDVLDVLTKHGLGGADVCHRIGRPTDDRAFRIEVADAPAIDTTLTWLRRTWSALTCRMQALRDNPDCAKQEYDNGLDETDPGMTFAATFDPDADPASGIEVRQKPRMAILREQGINGHVEMAAAFALAGFESIDVHMTDLLGGRVDLADFSGLVACGGFSYGDVLGAGSGWARSILFNARLAEMFRLLLRATRHRHARRLQWLPDGLAAQRNHPRRAALAPVPAQCIRTVRGALRHAGGARFALRAVDGHGGFAVAHRGGPRRRARVFEKPEDEAQAVAALRFVDGRGQATERYPWNPNGSKGGLTGFTTADGRATILMPHPERGFRSVQLSYRPADLFTGAAGPWMRLFRNAYAFVAASAR